MISRTSLNFSQIRPRTAELAALERLKQVAQRAMIAHLTASHLNILNSSQVKDFLNWSRQLTPQSMVGCGRISNSYETI